MKSLFEKLGFSGGPEDRLITPTKDQCGNCHAHLGPEDKFCRICGTRRGEGAYEPYREIMQCIYGPMPETRTHTCKQCGYSWTTCVMIDDQRYCPQCGGDAPYAPTGGGVWLNPQAERSES